MVSDIPTGTVRVDYLMVRDGKMQLVLIFPSWDKKKDSDKSLEDNALFLQNLVRSYKNLPILKDSGKQYISCKILTRFLQELRFLQNFWKIGIVCKNLARNIYFCKNLWRFNFAARIWRKLARYALSSSRVRSVLKIFSAKLLVVFKWSRSPSATF